jgi:hypothetical protein
LCKIPNKGHRSKSSYALSTAVIYALAVVPKVFSSIGQKGQVPGPLDRRGQTPLVLGTGSCPTARLDLAPIGEKPTQAVGLLVVYDFNLVGAKGAYLATGDELPPPPVAAGSPSPGT